MIQNTQRKFFYGGIGSRATPETICNEMTQIASRLENIGMILRSGHAQGADKAFEKGVSDPKMMEIFIHDDAEKWAYDMVSNYLPVDYKVTKEDFFKWKPHVQALLARNMMIMLGAKGDEPVHFVVAWTPTDDYTTSKAGGTGYLLRAAHQRRIKIFNFFVENNKKEFYEFLNLLEGNEVINDKSRQSL